MAGILFTPAPIKGEKRVGEIVTCRIAIGVFLLSLYVLQTQKFVFGLKSHNATKS